MYNSAFVMGSADGSIRAKIAFDRVFARTSIFENSVSEVPTAKQFVDAI